MNNIIDPKLLVSNVMKNYKHVANILKSSNSLDIDLGHITEIDSAGLAFLIELKSNKKVKLNNLSASIDNLCQLYKIKL